MSEDWTKRIFTDVPRDTTPPPGTEAIDAEFLNALQDSVIAKLNTGEADVRFVNESDHTKAAHTALGLADASLVLPLTGGTITGPLVLGANSLQTNADNAVGSTSAHALIFKTNNVERARFDSGGDLQFPDATNPKLKVYPSGKIQFDSNSLHGAMDDYILRFTQRYTTPRVGKDRVIYVNLDTRGAGGVADGHVGIGSLVQDRTEVANRAITNITDNGSGLMRITSTAHGFVTGERVHIYGISGTGNVLALNNTMAYITVIDANTLDLVSSSFGGTYTSGGTISNRGLFYAFSATVFPRVSRGGLQGTSIHGDDVAALTISNGNGAVAKGTDAIYISESAGSTQSEWNTLFTADCRADYGIRFNNYIDQYALDFSAGTQGQGQIRLANNSWIKSRNAASNADLSAIKVNAAGEIETGIATRLGASLRNTEGGGHFNPRTHAYDYDDFLSGSAAGSGTLGRLGWSLTTATAAGQSSVSGHHGIHRISSTATANQICAMHLKTGGALYSGDDFEILFIVKPVEADGTIKIRCGLSDGVTSDTATSHVIFEKDFADTTWFVYNRAASTSSTRVNTSVNTTAGTWYRMKIRRSGSTIYYSIDGGTETSMATNVPAATVQPYLQVTSNDANVSNVDIDYFEMLVAAVR